MELPPDPYVALGVSAAATDSQIKTAYRKLALRCHPDKVPDKGDEFHNISQAYELLADPDKRRRYDDEMKFNNLKMSGGSSGRRPSTSRYTNVRTRTAERPKPSYDDDMRFRDGMFDPEDLNRAASSRKYDDEERPRRTSAPNPSRAKEATKKTERSNTVRDKYRDSNERKKQRDREAARGRNAKYFAPNVDSDSGEESPRWVPSRGRSRQDGRRSPAAGKERNYREAVEYQRASVSRPMQEGMSSMEFAAGAAPPPMRSSGSFEGEKRSKPAGFMRRSRRSSAARETPSPEPPLDGGRRPPGFHSAYSSPSSLKPMTRDYPPSSTRRAYTFNDPQPYEVPPPKLERSSTMPVHPGRQTSTRRGSATPAFATNLRKMDVPNDDSGYSTSNSPSEAQSPDQLFAQGSTSTRYTYANSKEFGGPELASVDSKQFGGRSSRRSPDNTERPSLNRVSSASYKYTPPEVANPVGAPPPPPPSQTTGSRRPSMSHGESFTSSRRNTSTTQVPPSLSHSRRAASFAAPSSASPVPPMRTGQNVGNPPPGTSNGNNSRYYFGEQLRTSSPLEAEFIPPPPMGAYAPSTARRAAENVNYARYDGVRTSPNYPDSAPRRASEQVSGSIKDLMHEKEQLARQHMKASEQENRRSTTFADNIPLRGRGLRRETAV